MLVFETEPLAADVEVTGAIEANLWISSDAVDTDFTIKLIDLVSAQRGLPAGLCVECHRRNPAVPLSPILVGSDFDDTR